MHIVDILIILGCLAVGYWIVNSVIGKGIDTKDAERKAPPPLKEAGKPLLLPGAKPPASAPAWSAKPGPVHDWFIVLDIPSDSSRKDIQAAMKRRLAQAQADGDTASTERIRQAAEAGMKQAR
jgi:hypothetical protein